MAKAEKQVTLIDPESACHRCAGKAEEPGKIYPLCPHHLEFATTATGVITPPPPLTLWQKINIAMERVGYVQKKGENKEQHYKFVTAADVAEKARGAFTSLGIIMLPALTAVDIRERPTRSGGVATIARVTMSYCLRNVDNPDETYTFDMVSEGFDSGDKAIPKAITSAFKYALLQLLMISTGDDPEADPSTDKDPPVEPKVTEAQLFALNALIHQADSTPDKVCAHFHVESLAEMTNAQYERATKMLDDYLKKQATKNAAKDGGL